ncbi:MAG: DUF3291 domain-containing protein [Pseudomonadota bacterium]
MSSNKHLAQVNIGRVLGGPDDPRMTDFFDNLRRINELAERMPGFVWRLQDETGDGAMALHWPGDPTMNVNMSVWEDDATLARFVFQTVHQSFYARKHDFFEMPDKPTVALWWVDVGHVPTIDEAKERLDHLIANGPSDFSFTWADLPAAKVWRERRCA